MFKFILRFQVFNQVMKIQNYILKGPKYGKTGKKQQ